MKIFGERLKELRLSRNLSMYELAKELKINHSTVSRWENNTIVPSIIQLYNIARYFDVSTDYLLGLED